MGSANAQTLVYSDTLIPVSELHGPLAQEGSEEIGTQPIGSNYARVDNLERPLLQSRRSAQKFPYWTNAVL